MGVVYRAVAPDGRVVALKVLRRELAGSELYRRRFEHEIRVARGVRHRNLVPVLDAGEADGVPYLASQFVPGRSLGHRLDGGGACRWTRRCASPRTSRPASAPSTASGWSTGT